MLEHYNIMILSYVGPSRHCVGLLLVLAQDHTDFTVVRRLAGTRSFACVGLRAW